MEADFLALSFEIGLEFGPRVSELMWFCWAVGVFVLGYLLGELFRETN